MLLGSHHILQLGHVINDVPCLNERYAFGVVMSVLPQDLDLLAVALVQFDAENAEDLFAGLLADFGEEVFVQIGKGH